MHILEGIPSRHGSLARLAKRIGDVVGCCLLFTAVHLQATFRVFFTSSTLKHQVNIRKMMAEKLGLNNYIIIRMPHFISVLATNEVALAIIN